MGAWPGNPPQRILTLKDDGELLSLGSILIMIWYALVKVCAKFHAVWVWTPTIIYIAYKKNRQILVLRYQNILGTKCPHTPISYTFDLY